MFPIYFPVDTVSPLVKSTHLSEGRPLSFRALVHVVVGVCVGVEDPRGAQLVHGVQTDPRRVPEPHRAVLVSSGGGTHAVIRLRIHSNVTRMLVFITHLFLFF